MWTALENMPQIVRRGYSGTVTAHFERIAAAYVRGKLNSSLPESLVLEDLRSLGDTDLDAILQIGREAGLRLHRFKRTMGLARVERVLGTLHGIAPESLLDIGSGRGVFLWPLLDAVPWLEITACDMLDYRVADIQAVRDGGFTNLNAQLQDATNLTFPDASFDVVTALEVLEHIPDAAQAIAEIVRVARRFVIASVPSQPDDNPEHIHLFSHADLERMFAAAGVKRVNFESVLNHTIAVAKVER
jgi:2-polyprenyl-3-methyl-5-hydroxy-6-metoxy-1,4-benzoquinol methylase